MKIILLYQIKKTIDNIKKHLDNLELDVSVANIVEINTKIKNLNNAIVALNKDSASFYNDKRTTFMNKYSSYMNKEYAETLEKINEINETITNLNARTAKLKENADAKNAEIDDTNQQTLNLLQIVEQLNAEIDVTNQQTSGILKTFLDLNARIDAANTTQELTEDINQLNSDIQALLYKSNDVRGSISSFNGLMSAKKTEILEFNKIRDKKYLFFVGDLKYAPAILSTDGHVLTPGTSEGNLKYVKIDNNNMYWEAFDGQDAYVIYLLVEKYGYFAFDAVEYFISLHYNSRSSSEEMIQKFVYPYTEDLDYRYK